MFWVMYGGLQQQCNFFYVVVSAFLSFVTFRRPNSLSIGCGSVDCIRQFVICIHEFGCLVSSLSCMWEFFVCELVFIFGMISSLFVRYWRVVFRSNSFWMFFPAIVVVQTSAQYVCLQQTSANHMYSTNLFAVSYTHLTLPTILLV